MEEKELSDAKGAELFATEALVAGLEQLKEDEEVKLSKVLFPETHTMPVVVLGIERNVTPLTLKRSKMLFSLLAPIAKKFGEAMQDTKNVHDMDGPAIEGLIKAVTIIAEANKWNDVLEALKEEEVSLSELQTVAVRQQAVNGENDFLLGPLRTIIRVMQMHEIMQIRFHSLLTSQQFAGSGTSTSTD